MSVVGAQVRAIMRSTSNRRHMYLTMEMVSPIRLRVRSMWSSDIWYGRRIREADLTRHGTGLS